MVAGLALLLWHSYSELAVIPAHRLTVIEIVYYGVDLGSIVLMLWLDCFGVVVGLFVESSLFNCFGFVV